MPPIEQSKAKSLKEIWRESVYFSRYTKADRNYFFLASLTIFGIAATNTIMIWLFGKPLDLLQQGRYADVATIGLWFALIMLLNQGLHLATNVLNGWLSLRFIGRTRSAMLGRCLHATFPVMDRYPKGDVLTRLSGDLDKLSRLTVDTPLLLVSHAFIFIFYSTMLFLIDVPLALLALLLTPLFILHQRIFGQRKRRVSEQFFDRLGRLLSFETETLSNLRGISSFGVETHVTGLHSDNFSIAQKWAMKSKWLDAWFSSSFSVLVYLVGLLIVVGGIFQIQAGTLSPGQLVSFLLYLGYLSLPVRGVATLALSAQEDMASADRVRAVLNLDNIVREIPNAPDLPPCLGNIDFNELVFSYDASKIVFNRINLSIRHGETIALVGPSGAGKSTFAKLLMRFYDPQSGAIKIDGTDISTVNLASLRAQIAVVWQETFLINDTLAANLLLSRQSASHEELVQACKLSHAWEFICTLPQGLDTVLGANGTDLSAGQRQRLAIAQAFLRNAPILLLDEASSALDSQSEEIIVNALAKLREGRTTLVIAHRYSSIRDADRVVYFNGDGTLTTGTHAQLAESHNEYKQALEWQNS